MPLRSMLAIVLACFAVSSLPAAGQGVGSPSASKTPFLRGLTQDEANSIVAKLQELQKQLRSGEKVYFQLLSGAPASYPETTLSPRELFLEMPFEKTRWFERIPNGNPLWKPHKLTIQLNGPGSLVWEVEVVVGFNGNIERVEMFYQPPAPF